MNDMNFSQSGRLQFDFDEIDMNERENQAALRAIPLDPHGRDVSKTMLTASGRMFWPFDPRPEDVVLDDMIIALNREYRFNGHINLSVLKHTYVLSHVVPPALRLEALVHDCGEAYLSDIPRPIKVRPEFAFYREAEDRLFVVICQALKLPFTTLTPEFNDWDKAAGRAELHLFFKNGYHYTRRKNLEDKPGFGSMIREITAGYNMFKGLEGVELEIEWKNRFFELYWNNVDAGKDRP